MQTTSVFRTWRNLFLEFTLLLVLGACSSSSSNECLVQFEVENPEISKQLDSLNPRSEESGTCFYRILKDTLVYGQSETNSKGIFFKDSMNFQGMEVHELRCYDPKTKFQKHKFVVFSFAENSELLRFQSFCSSISRSLNQGKELHSFSHFPDKTILFYKGFP